MTEEPFELQARDAGTYSVRARSLDGHTTFTLVLADDTADDNLPADEPTARATVRYLLEHQDATDLPPWIELTDIAAAYPGALERIATLRGSQ